MMIRTCFPLAKKAFVRVAFFGNVIAKIPQVAHSGLSQLESSAQPQHHDTLPRNGSNLPSNHAYKKLTCENSL